MNRISILLCVGACFACNAWARVGETPDEVAKRYGLPRDVHAGPYSNTITRLYNKDGIQVEATFMTNTVGKSFVGEIRYTLPKEIGQSNEVAKTVLTQLLDANAAGQVWELQINRPATQEYHRLGASATMAPTRLTVTLDEFAALVAAEKNRLVTEQSNRIDKHLKDF